MSSQKEIVQGIRRKKLPFVWSFLASFIDFTTIIMEVKHARFLLWNYFFTLQPAEAVLGKDGGKKNVELGFYVFVYILLLKVIVGFCCCCYFFLHKVKVKSHFMSIRKRPRPMCWNALVSATLEEFLLSSKWPCCDCAPYFFFFSFQNAKCSRVRWVFLHCSEFLSYCR